MRYAWGGVGLEGRYDFPASNGSVSAQLVTLALVPCAHYGRAFGCARVSWGEIIGEAGRARAAPYFALGARAGIEIPIAGPLELRAHFDVDAALTQTTLTILDKPVWDSPVLGVSAGLAGLVRFP